MTPSMSMGFSEKKLFFQCLIVSLAVHMCFVVLAAPSWNGGSDTKMNELAERFTSGVDSATPLGNDQLAQINSMLDSAPKGFWRQDRFNVGVSKMAATLGLKVAENDLVRAHDPARAKEGRWDIRVWLDWPPGSSVNDVAMLAYIVGEGTLKSDFGSHRFWVNLEGPDGSGRAVFETIDCRLLRNGKLSSTDFLYRGQWEDR